MTGTPVLAMAVMTFGRYGEEYVYGELLGMSSAEIKALTEEGVS